MFCTNYLEKSLNLSNSLKKSLKLVIFVLEKYLISLLALELSLKFRLLFTPYDFPDIMWNDPVIEDIFMDFWKFSTERGSKNVNKVSVWKSGHGVSMFLFKLHPGKRFFVLKSPWILFVWSCMNHVDLSESIQTLRKSIQLIVPYLPVYLKSTFYSLKISKKIALDLYMG